MSYTSDLTDQEWSIIEPLVSYSGPCRPRKHSMRVMLNAIFYLEKTGCQWRMLPVHFPPWKNVYELYYRWRLSGKWDQIHNTLRSQVREKSVKAASPTAAIIDSRSVKTAQKGGLEATMGERKLKAASTI
jgi:putative transposase